jgi:hypothetical protein
MASTSGSHWSLSCQALGQINQPVGVSVVVHIDPSAFIHDLKEEVFKKLPSVARKHFTELILTDSDLWLKLVPGDLEFWKLSEPLFGGTVSDVFKNATLKFPDLELADEAADNSDWHKVELLLDPFKMVSEYWDGVPPERCLHIVVRVPPVHASGTS